MPAAARAYYESTGMILIGGVMARAGQADSARALWREARVGSDVDEQRELRSLEAAMRVLVGDHDEAVDLLEQYVMVNPGHFSSNSRLHWWWHDLVGRSDFEQLRKIQ